MVEKTHLHPFFKKKTVISYKENSLFSYFSKNTVAKTSPTIFFWFTYLSQISAEDFSLFLFLCLSTIYKTHNHLIAYSLLPCYLNNLVSPLDLSASPTSRSLVYFLTVYSSEHYTKLWFPLIFYPHFLYCETAITVIWVYDWTVKFWSLRTASQQVVLIFFPSKL